MKAVKPQWPPCFTATAGLAASMHRVLREFVSGQWWHKSSIQHCRVGLRPILLCLPHWLAVLAGGTTVVAYWCWWWWQYKYWWWRWQETEAWNYNPDDQSVMLNVFSLSLFFFFLPLLFLHVIQAWHRQVWFPRHSERSQWDAWREAWACCRTRWHVIQTSFL